MAQPQPCAHEFDPDMFCTRCGQPAERVVDMPEHFGTCWIGSEQFPTVAVAVKSARPGDAIILRCA